MARTAKGNLTGMAARTDLADQRDYLLDMQIKQDAIIRQQRIDELMQACYDIEGDTFIDWWEDDRNVPAIITRTKQIEILEARLKMLTAAQPTDGEPCTVCLRIHPPTEHCAG